MGRRGVSRARRSDTPERAAGAGYDVAAHEVQELCGRRSQAQEHDEGAGASEGRASVPYPETYLWICKSEIPWVAEEPPGVVRGVRAGELIPTP